MASPGWLRSPSLGSDTEGLRRGMLRLVEQKPAAPRGSG